MDAINAILKAREEIDTAVRGYLDQVAILRKKSEALRNTLDILRENERAIEDAPAPRPVAAPQRKARGQYDEAAIEEAAMNALQAGPLSLGRIMGSLNRLNIEYSEYMLRRILQTKPGITTRGSGPWTRYMLDGKMEAA